jgi:hypothetical protein
MTSEENKNLIDEITKRFDAGTKETKRHFDVVSEDMKSQFKVFGEQLSDIKTKVDLLVEDMDYVKSALADNKERFKETADKTVVADHENRIIKLENTALA